MGSAAVTACMVEGIKREKKPLIGASFKTFQDKGIRRQN